MIAVLRSVAQRGSPTKQLKIAAAATVVLSLLIVVGGGVVRLTGSGLGCPDWPKCTGGSLAPTQELSWHATVEYTNRLLTVLLCIGIGVFIILSWLHLGLRDRITKSGFLQMAIVVLNAVVGGISVWTGLNPWIVAGHFIAAMLLVMTAAISFELVQLRAGVAAPRISRALPRAILVLTGVVVVIGTVVTGSGPHSGDANALHRMPFDWIGVTIVHGAAAGLLIIVALIYAAGIAPTRVMRSHRRQAMIFLLLLALQAVVGIAQAYLGLPGVAVIAHLLMAAMLWAGAVRIYLGATGLSDKAPAPIPDKIISV